MHDEEAAGHVAFGLLPLAVGDGGMADVLVEETTERSQTLKPDFKTNVRDAQFVGVQQFFRLLHAAFDQVLMRSFIERLAEESEEVITREASLLGDLVETEWVIVTVVDKLTRTSETL